MNSRSYVYVDNLAVILAFCFNKTFYFQGPSLCAVLNTATHFLTFRLTLNLLRTLLRQEGKFDYVGLLTYMYA